MCVCVCLSFLQKTSHQHSLIGKVEEKRKDRDEAGRGERREVGEGERKGEVAVVLVWLRSSE